MAGYTAQFNELTYPILGLTNKDKFSAYHLGLILCLQPEVSLSLEEDSERSVERATVVAMQVEEYLKIKYSGKEGENKKPQKLKGAVNVVQDNKEGATGDTAQVNVMEKKPWRNRGKHQVQRLQWWMQG